MKRVLLIFTSIALLAIGTIGCQAVQQMRNFSQCAFRLENLNQFNIVGIDMAGRQSISDFGLMDAARITSALAGNNPMPLGFTANLEVRNPNTEKAAVNRLDWVVAIDGKDIINGTNEGRVEVEGNGGTAKMPLRLSLNLKEVFQQNERDKMLGFAFDTALQGENSSRLAIKVRPYVNVAGFSVPYPGFITLAKAF